MFQYELGPMISFTLSTDVKAQNVAPKNGKMNKCWVGEPGVTCFDDRRLAEGGRRQIPREFPRSKPSRDLAPAGHSLGYEYLSTCSLMVPSTAAQSSHFN